VKIAERSLVLIGFMGAGKSAVGRELATRLRLPRYDTDEMIRQRFAMPIPEIFARCGETAFREAESEVLWAMQTATTAVLVTGGGIVLRAANVARLGAIGRRIWLDAEEETLWQRASRRQTRPLLQDPNPRERFSALFLERSLLYRSAADDRVETTGATIPEVADRIVALL
jgi:shikimate kinase